MGVLNIFKGKAEPITYIKAKHNGADGIACAAMLAGHYKFASPAEILNRFSKTSERINMNDLVTIFAEYDRKFSAFQAEAEDLSKIACPAILYWKYSQFVVLVEVKSKKGDISYLIYDPLTNKSWLTFQEIAINFSGALLVIDEN